MSFKKKNLEVCEEALSGAIMVAWGVAVKLVHDWLKNRIDKDDKVSEQPKS